MVFINSAVFLIFIFAFSFTRPSTRQDSRVLYAARREGRLAVSGPYARVRHPQYAGFAIILIGFLLQWPTLLTVLVLPVLLVMYVRLARAEEHEMSERFGNEWVLYSENTPAFVPRLRRSSPMVSVTSRRR